MFNMVKYHLHKLAVNMQFNPSCVGKYAIFSLIVNGLWFKSCHKYKYAH